MSIALPLVYGIQELSWIKLRDFNQSFITNPLVVFVSQKLGYIILSVIIKFCQILRSIYRRDRTSRGGGVMIAVSDQIPSRQIPISFSVEIVIILLAPSPRLILRCVYIPLASPDYFLSHTIYVTQVNPRAFKSNITYIVSIVMIQQCSGTS